MKKSTILLVVCFAFNQINLNAQDIKFGLKGSFLGSSFSSSDDGIYSYRPGYSIGGYFQYTIIEMLGVSVEPAFAKKGANEFDANNLYDPYSPIFYDGTTAIEYKRHDISVSVVELPVLCHFNLNIGGDNRIRLFAGPSIDFITKATHYKTRANPLASDSSEEIKSSSEITERFPYVDYGMQAGVGFDMDLEPVGISIELKYRYGFSDVNNVKGKPSMNSHNFGITVGVGLEKLFF